MCVGPVAKWPPARVAIQPPSVESSNDCGKKRSVSPCSRELLLEPRAGRARLDPRGARDRRRPRARGPARAGRRATAPAWPGRATGVDAADHARAAAVRARPRAARRAHHSSTRAQLVLDARAARRASGACGNSPAERRARRRGRSAPWACDARARGRPARTSAAQRGGAPRRAAARAASGTGASGSAEPKPRCAASPAAAARSSAARRLLVLVAPAPVLAPPRRRPQSTLSVACPSRPASSPADPGRPTRWRRAGARTASSRAPERTRGRRRGDRRARGPRLALARRARRAARRLRGRRRRAAARAAADALVAAARARGRARRRSPALCVVRDADGRWLAGRRAPWVATLGRPLGARRRRRGRGRRGPGARRSTRELAEEWSVEPERADGRGARRACPTGMVDAGRPGLAARRAPRSRRDHEHDAHAWWPRRPGRLARGGRPARCAAWRRLLDARDHASRALKYLSFAHSAIYLTLLVLARRRTQPARSTCFGWAHGIGWIVMSLLCLAAVRRRVIPLWLGVMVAVVGGLGPFAGSVGFVVRTSAAYAGRKPRPQRGMV